MDELGDRNAAFCRCFISRLLADGLTAARCNAYIDTFLTFGRFVQKDFDRVTREDVERFFTELVSRGYSRWTIVSFKARLKRFYKWLLGGDETYPPQVSWIKVNSVKNQLPADILSVDEVNAMANAADNLRDKALVLVLYEAGLRAGELLELRIKDVIVDKYGAILHVSGKTGDRRVRIIASAPALLEWLNHHPMKDNPDARIFGKEPDYSRMSYTALSKILRKLAKKAGIRKRIYPHLFRHSRATHLASHLKEAQLCEYFGWVKGSRMPQIYIHLSGRELDPELFRLAGLEVEAEKLEENRFRPKLCPRCGERNTPNEEFCKRCGLPLNQETAAKILIENSREIDALQKEVDELKMEWNKLRNQLTELLRIIERESKPKTSIKLGNLHLGS